MGGDIVLHSVKDMLFLKVSLTNLFRLQENEKQRDIMIEYRFHRLIIGQGGENIKEIREKFNQVSLRQYVK